MTTDALTTGLQTTGRRRPVAVLVGFMGAGKTTVAAEVARLLGLEVVDTDAEILLRDGRTIPQIFADDGERGFRALEAQVVADVLSAHPGVVALGGGAVLSPSVRSALAGHRVVHLDVDPAAGYARVAGSPRPLLADPAAGPDPAARYAALHAERAALYGDVATLRIDTTTSTPAQVAEQIVAAIGDPLAAHRHRGAS